VSTFFVLTGHSIASDGTVSVDSKLAELKSATEITLFIVPYPSYFRSNVDKGRLADVSCTYRIASVAGPAFGEVFDVIRHAGIQYDDRPAASRNADLRVGIIFTKSSEVLWEFYSSDFGRTRSIDGYWGDVAIVASSDLPNRLRALLLRTNAFLVKSDHYSRSECMRL